MNNITITDKQNTIIITLAGDAYDTLKRMADALNEWSINGEDERDNTPLTVFENFFTWELDLLEHPSDETSSNVVEGIDTRTDDCAEEHRRQDELTDLMAKHGIPTYKELFSKIDKLTSDKKVAQA